MVTHILPEYLHFGKFQGNLEPYRCFWFRDKKKVENTCVEWLHIQMSVKPHAPKKCFHESGKNNLPANTGDAASIPGSGSSPGEGNGNPNPAFLPGKFHGQRSLAGYSSQIHKSQIQLSD